MCLGALVRGLYVFRGFWSGVCMCLGSLVWGLYVFRGSILESVCVSGIRSRVFIHFGVCWRKSYEPFDIQILYGGGGISYINGLDIKLKQFTWWTYCVALLFTDVESHWCPQNLGYRYRYIYSIFILCIFIYIHVISLARTVRRGTVIQ